MQAPRGAPGGRSETINIFRSDDGGASFSSAKGTLTNPDTVCTSMDIGASQSGFNQAIAVDPSDGDRVIVAGLFCSVRTLNGRSATPTWQVVSDVYGSQTQTACGSIPYVHSDFHAALISAGQVLLGGDGGIEASADALSVATGNECSVAWTNENHGLTTHLCYSIASGDPTTGDAEVAYTGMQDLSSRWRDPQQPGRWNTINLSDGTGGAVVHTSADAIYWSAQVGSDPDRQFCKRSAGADCGVIGSWHASDPPLPAGDTEAFVTNLAALDAEAAGGVISHSTYNVWKADATPAWTNISGQHCDPAGGCATGGFAPDYISAVAASPTTGSLYGIALIDHTAVTSDGGATWTVSNPLGVGSDPAQRVGYAPSALAFPAGRADGPPGDVYVAGTAAELLADGAVIPPAIGHLFVTRDRGVTWTPMAGSGATALPNVPVWAVKYDPHDASGQTLYVATELGLYASVDGGGAWARVGSGLPMVRSTDLAIAHDGSFVRLSTWGRGVWQFDVADPGNGGGDGTPPSRDGAPPATGSGGGCGGCGTTGDPGAPLALAMIGWVVVRIRGRITGCWRIVRP